MSQNTAFSMNELELESAELLPARETLCAVKCSHGSHGGYTSVVTQQDGNTAQVGLINVSLLNGNFDNIW